MKKKIMAAALAVCMVATLVVGMSLAYFTDTKTAENTFTMGNVKITLDEAKVTKDGDKWTAGTERVTGNDYGMIYPGAVLPKDPTVHNTGASGAYIRAKVNVSNWMNIVGAVFPDFKETFPNDGYKAALNLLVDQLGAGWSVVGVEQGDTFTVGQFDAKFVLKYDGILPAGESTTAMFTNVNVPTAFESGYEYLFNEISVVAEAIQSDGFTSWEAAFAAFDAE